MSKPKPKIDISRLNIDELLTNEKFIKFAVENKLIPNTDDDEEKVLDNFKADEAFKYTFKNIEGKYIIRMINDMCKTNYSENCHIHFASTEFVGSTGDPTKRKVLGDMALVIEELEETNSDELTNTIIIEFQSSEDDEMPIRIHVYAFNHTTEVEMDTNFIKNGAIEKVKKKVQIYPHTIVIYTTLTKKEKYGQEEFNFSFPNFLVNGIEYSAVNGDIVTQVTPFINILKLSLDEINNSTFDFLQGLYLYKFKKNISLVKNEDISEIFEIIEENLKKFKGVSYHIVLKLYVDLMEDLYLMMKKNETNYKKELNSMEYYRETFYDKTVREATEKATEKATEIATEIANKKATEKANEKAKNIILRMLKRFDSSEEIHELTGFPLSQINEIRDNNIV